MRKNEAGFIDRRDSVSSIPSGWKVCFVPSARIEEQIRKLATGSAGSDGRREVAIAHPDSDDRMPGLAPGIEVVFGTLLPGESTRSRRRNTSTITMCLHGRGRAEIEDVELSLGDRDVWVTPSMNVHQLMNTSGEPFVYVEYSSRPLLEALHVFYEELEPPIVGEERQALAAAAERSAKTRRAKELVPGFSIGEGDAWLLPYEHLIDPEPVVSKAIQWRWEDVLPHLGKVRRLGRGYTGRPLYCFYNPATGNRNGTTSCFFATIASVGPNARGPTHRHSSAAINYILEGSGWSVIDEQRVDWSAGDIMLSAPGWAPHAHSTGPDGALILTVQDHPLQIGAESLIWQEDLENGPILSLGTHAGFETNLAQILKES